MTAKTSAREAHKRREGTVRPLDRQLHRCRYDLRRHDVVQLPAKAIVASIALHHRPGCGLGCVVTFKARGDL